MESASWSLRLALALVVASAIWAGAIALTNKVVAGRAGQPTPGVAIARTSVPAGSHAASAR
jgi:hypothetical protein